MKRKNKSVWRTHSELESHLHDIIYNSEIFRKEGYEGVRKELIKRTGVKKLPLKSIKVKIGQLVWQDKNNTLKLEPLKNRKNVYDEEISRFFPTFPVDFVRNRLNKVNHRKDDARSDVPERALGLVQDPKELELRLNLPPTTLDNPYLVPVKDPDNPRVEILNAPQIGLIYPKKIERNITRNKVMLAEACGADAIIIPGNIFHMDLKRTSPDKPVRSVISGMHVKPDILVRGGAYDSEEEIKKFLEADDVIFIPMQQRFEVLLDGLHKIFHKKDGKTPLFYGRVLVQLGLQEDEIISRAAYEELRVRVAIVKNRINAQIRHLRKEISKLDKEKEKNNAEIKESINQRIEILTKRLKNVIMSQANDEFLRKWREKFAAWMIKKIEETIPNSKVVSIGEAFFRLGKNGPIIQSITVPNTSVSDTELGKQVEDARKRTSLSLLADVILVCSKTAIEQRWVPVNYRDQEGRDHTSFVIQPPVLLDRDFLRKCAAGLVKVTEPIQRMLGREELYTGSLGLEFVRVGDKWILKQNKYDSRFLANPENFTKEYLERITNPNSPEIIYMARQGETHEGHPYVILYPTNEAPYFLRHDEAFLKFLLESNAPIFNWIDQGDILQGRHFENQNAPHHHEYLRQSEFLELIKEIERSNKKPEEKFTELAKAAARQVMRAGEIRPQDQEINYKNRFIRNEIFLKFCVNVILRNRNHKIVMGGDYAPIIILPGDHMTKTHKGEYLESLAIRETLVDALETYCLKKNINLTRKEIDKCVKAPNIGEHGAGFGAFGYNRFTYSVGVRHKQEAVASKFGDTTKRARIYRDKRGSHTSLQQGLWRVDFRGDAHMGGGSCSNFGDYLATGCQTEPDPFGEWHSYPNPHMGSDIEGLPKEGPKKGWRVTISITKSIMEAWLKDPSSLKVKNLFRNAVK